MRSRLPLILIALTILLSVAAAGCGDDKSDDGTATPAGATQSTDAAATGPTGAAIASAQKTLDTCLDGALAIPDADKSAKAKKQCQDAYDNIAKSSKKVDAATSEARVKCDEAANKIANEQAKSSALAACAQFK